MLEPRDLGRTTEQGSNVPRSPAAASEPRPPGSGSRASLTPEVLAQVRDLELRARLIVEGHLAGLHQSKYHGFSVEFAQHREYVPGDDLRHVDWKVHGRTERYYLKQHVEETNLVCWVLVDASESMGYRSGTWSKYEYAATLASALAYLVLRQGDRVGVAVFNDQVRAFLRPVGHPVRLKEVVQALDRGPAREKGRLQPIFHELAERTGRRGVVAVFSDFLDDVPELLAALGRLRYQRHEVIAFHVLDPAELDFPFREPTLFRGLEGEGDLLTDPRSLRSAYLAELATFIGDLRRGCRSRNIEYVQLRTDQDVGTSLASYLAKRGRGEPGA